MKTDILHDTSHYLSLPYTTVLRKDDEGDYVGRVEELQGCVAHGATEIEALESLKRMQELWIQDCIEAGDPVPLPKEEENLPSGKWVQRVPRSLHRKLAERAKRDDVSLNQLVTSMLAEAIGQGSMAGVIDECLVARFAAHQLRDRMGWKHIDVVWGQQGNWRAPRSSTPNFELPKQVASVIGMMTPATCTVLYDDNQKETSDPWRPLR